MTDDVIKAELSASPHRESFLGGHFFSVYNECPRKFYLRYICGFKPPESERFFVRGQAIHSGIEYFFKNNHDTHTCIRAGQIYMELNRVKLGRTFDEDYELITDMLTEWTRDIGSKYTEGDALRNIGCEVATYLTLPNGFRLSVRFDRVEEDLSGMVYIIDTKTTGRNFQSAYDGLKWGEQAISYYIAGQQLYGDRFRGVIGDVLVGKNLKAGPITTAHVTPVLTYNQYAQNQYMLGMVGLISEITQKVKALRFSFYPPELLFYRKTDRCSWLGCPFRDFCRLPIHPETNPASFGCRRDEWYIENNGPVSVPDADAYMDGLLNVLPPIPPVSADTV